MVAGLEAIAKQLPFPVLGTDSDNDSVFINDTLTEYCAGRGIEFTSKGLMDIRGVNIMGLCEAHEAHWVSVRGGPRKTGYAIGATDVLQRAFATTVESHLAFRGRVRQEA